MSRTRLVLLALVLTAACGGSTPPPASTTTTSTTSTPTTSSTTTQAEPAAVVASKGDAPEISRSVGVEGGVVVLWPRLAGKDEDGRKLAARIQQRLQAAVQRALPGRAVDVRPEPERVCPRAGCKAVTVGAALMRNGNACAVVALVSPSGPSAATIVPWVGQMSLRNPTAGFREPPEPEVQVRDYEVCAKVDGALDAKLADIEAAIRLVAGG